MSLSCVAQGNEEAYVDVPYQEKDKVNCHW